MDGATPQPLFNWQAFDWTKVAEAAIYAVVAVVVLAICAGLILLAVRAGKQVARAVKARAEGEAPEVPLHRAARDAWRRLCAALPASADAYPVVVVLGEPGAGKTHLIGRALKQTASEQGQPQGVEHAGELHFYEGTGVLVQEIGGALLHDESRDAVRALRGIFRTLRGRPVRVVIVIDALGVCDGETDLTSLGRSLRAKLDLLDERRRTALDIHLYLTRMDQLEGYDTFVQVEAELGRPTRRKPLEQGEVPLDDTLDYALTHVSGGRFRQLISLGDALPGALARLRPLFQELSESKTRCAAGLYLSGLDGRAHPDDMGPFVATGQELRERAKQLQQDRGLYWLAAVSAASVALVLLYGVELDRVKHAVDSVNRIGHVRAEQETRSFERARDALRRADYTVPPLSFFTFSDAKEAMRARFSQRLAEERLLPIVERGQRPRRILLAAALLHAKPGDAMGRLARRRPEIWVQGLGLPAAVVEQYLEGVGPWRPGGEALDALARRELVPPWERDLQKLCDASASDALTDEAYAVLRDLPLLSTGLEVQLGLGEVVATLEAAPTLHPGIRKVLRAAGRPAWIGENREGLERIAGLVMGEDVAVDQRTPPPEHLGELLARLESMIAPQAEEPPQPIEIAVSEELTQRFDVEGWTRVLTGLRASRTIDALRQKQAEAKARAKDGDEPPRAFAWLDEGAAGLVNVAPPPLSREGSSAGATAEIARHYTVQQLDNVIVPALERGEAVAKALSPDPARALRSLLSREMESYARAYARSYEAYYRSFQLEISRPPLLTVMAASAIEADGWFARFLDQVVLNTRFAAMAEKPDLQPYARILDEELGSLARFSASWSEKSMLAFAQLIGAALPLEADPTDVLGGMVAAPGRGVLARLRAEQPRLVNDVRDTLLTQGVQGSLQEPFITVAVAVQRAGGAQLERACARAWRGQLEPLIAPLLERFPFDPDRSQEVTVAELTDVLGPEGSFWALSDATVGEVLERDREGYAVRKRIFERPAYLDTLDRLVQLREALWNAKGDPIALVYDVTPAPLPFGHRTEVMPTSSYLTVGKSTVQGVNQRPAPLRLELEWAEAPTAVVGMFYSGQRVSERPFAVTAEESSWNLLRLLRVAHWEGRRAHWRIEAGPHGTATVKFTFARDPWALFRIPLDGEQHGD